MLTRAPSKQRQEGIILKLTGLPRVTPNIGMGSHHQLLRPSLFCQKGLDWPKYRLVLNCVAFLVFPVCQPQMVTSDVDTVPLDIMEMVSIAEVVWKLFRRYKESYLVHTNYEDMLFYLLVSVYSIYFTNFYSFHLFSVCLFSSHFKKSTWVFLSVFFK